MNMVDKVSYKSLRDQLISLSVDIEDKAKICSLLERKIEDERQQLGKVEVSMSENYENIIEAELEAHKENSRRKTTASQQLMQQKSDLVSRCHELVDSVKEQERELSAEVRSVYKDAEQTIENEKKTFRAGYEDRLQKFLSGKATEYKESTAKALGPEISRLQMLHEQELSAAKTHIYNEERSLQESMASKLQGRMDEERQAAKEELKLSARALQDKTAGEIDTAKREHRKQLQRQTDDLERDLERHRLFLKDKAQRDRDRAHNDMKLLQESSQQRILELQQRHAKHIESLQNEHEQELQALKRQAETQRKAHQSELRRELQKNSSGKYNDSDEDSRPRSSSGGKSSTKNGFSPQRTGAKASPYRSPGSRGGSRGGGSLRLDDIGANSGDDAASEDGGVQGGLLQPEDELEVAAMLRAGQEDRDRQIQAEIRDIESETLRLERQWRARAEAEEKQALAAVASEQEYSTIRKQRQQSGRGQGQQGGSLAAGEDIAELVVAREQLIQQLQTLKVQAERATQEEGEVSREVQVYKEGISAHRARIQDKQEQHRLRLRELQLEAGPTLRELREQVEVVVAQIREGAEKCRKQMSAVDKEHSTELAKLDTQVKSEVARRDEENEALRDCVEAELTKIARLEKLIKQYSSSSSSASTVPAFAVGNNHQPSESKRAGGEARRAISGGRSVTSTVSHNSGGGSTARSTTSNTSAGVRTATSRESSRLSHGTAPANSVAESLQKLRLSKTADSSRYGRSSSDNNRRSAEQTRRSAGPLASRATRDSRDRDRDTSGKNSASSEGGGNSGGSDTGSDDEGEEPNPNPLPAWIMEKQSR